MDLKKISAIIAVAVTGLVAPTVPTDLELQYSYQYNASDYQEYFTVDDSASSTKEKKTKEVKNEQPEFEDDNGDGVISVSVFEDGKGDKIYVQISEDVYKKMGEKDGYESNPTKTELQSVLEKLISPTVVDASVAIDSYDNSGGGTGTSTTFPFDNSAGDYLLVGVWKYSSAGTVSATYNGVSMTKIYEESTTSVSLVALGLAGPATGSNNVVISSSLSVSVLWGNAVSLSGAKQTGQPNTYDANGRTLINNMTTTVTTDVDGCGIVSFAVSDNGSLASNNANTTLMELNTGGNGSQFGSLRSTTFPQASAGSITQYFYKSTGGSTWMQAVTIAIEPVAVAGDVETQDVYSF